MTRKSSVKQSRTALSLSEFLTVRHKEIEKGSDVFQFGPPADRYRAGVEVINPGVTQRQQKRRMGGQDKLAAEETDGIFEKTSQFQLAFCGKAVFRFVQQIEGVFPDPVREIGEGVFSVGTAPHVVHHAAPGELRFRKTPGVVYFFQLIVIVQRIQFEAGISGVRIFGKELFSSDVNSLVESPDVQHVVENIVAGDNTAVFWNCAEGTAAAHIGEIPEKGSPVESRVSVKPQFFRDNIERCGFSGTVSAAENRYRFKVNRLQPPVGKNPEGVKRIIAGVFKAGDIFDFRGFSGKVELSYVHDGLLFHI